MSIEIKRLSTGYFRAQGDGPCEWAQWCVNFWPKEEDFFPEASAAFRKELDHHLSGRDEAD